VDIVRLASKAPNKNRAFVDSIILKGLDFAESKP